MNEEPLKLIPRELRSKIFPELAPPDKGYGIGDLGELNPACRFIFQKLMHKYEGLDYKQIGEVLKLSESATKSLLFRAYQTLREKLKDFV